MKVNKKVHYFKFKEVPDFDLFRTRPGARGVDDYNFEKHKWNNDKYYKTILDSLKEIPESEVLLVLL